MYLSFHAVHGNFKLKFIYNFRPVWDQLRKCNNLGAAQNAQFRPRNTLGPRLGWDSQVQVSLDSQYFVRETKLLVGTRFGLGFKLRCESGNDPKLLQLACNVFPRANYNIWYTTCVKFCVMFSPELCCHGDRILHAWICNTAKLRSDITAWSKTSRCLTRNKTTTVNLRNKLQNYPFRIWANWVKISCRSGVKDCWSQTFKSQTSARKVHR